MLDGPTSDMWIDPWVQHLKHLGVVFHLNTTLTSFQMSDDGSRVASASVVRNGQPDTVTADVFFSAVPAEKMAGVLSSSPGLLLAAPSLRQINELKTAWMVVRLPLPQHLMTPPAATAHLLPQHSCCHNTFCCS